MSDKPEPPIKDGTFGIATAYAELAALRAENERLADDNRRLTECWDTEMTAHKETHAENERLQAELQEALDFGVAEQRDLVLSRAENERLRLVEIASLEAEVRSHVDEIERLRAALEQIHPVDLLHQMLNPNCETCQALGRHNCQ